MTLTSRPGVSCNRTCRMHHISGVLQMRPEIAPYAQSPDQLPPELVKSMLQGRLRRKRSIKIWTSSRVLEQFAVPWWLPEHRRLLHRVDHLLRELEAAGDVVRRPWKQTSRNTRAEIAYEVAAGVAPPAEDVDRDS